VKIIFLNAWNGRVGDELRRYLKTQLPTTDIFCFQEAYDDMKALAGEVLTNYTAYTDFKPVNEKDNFWQATYIRKDLQVTASGTVLKEQPNSGFGVYVTVQADEQPLCIVNFHGMSRPIDKRDDPNRLAQSRALIEALASKAPVIVGGDFNLLPEAESIRMFAAHGYRDLIEEYNIPTTRNQLAWDQYPEPKFEKQYHSDYVFLSPELTLQDFTVPNLTISDHLPLEVTISE